MDDTSYFNLIEKELLAHAVIESERPHDPVKARNVPENWKCIGTGNYAAVFIHKARPDWVVKVYGQGKDGLDKETKVYLQLGRHPAFSSLIHKGKNYLVLKRLEGITLYNAVAKGIRIPESVIDDIEGALDYAKNRGLNPYDVHGKNVMMKDGKGYVVDISDFYKEGKDQKWDDLVKAYYKFYKKTLYKFPIRIPLKVLDLLRHSYRLYRALKS